jgi:hypothetical protein
MKSHQARDVYPPEREVVLVHVDMVTSQPAQTVRELARHVTGSGPQVGRELGGDQNLLAGKLAEPPLRRPTGIQRCRVEEGRPAAMLASHAPRSSSRPSAPP